MTKKLQTKANPNILLLLFVTALTIFSSVNSKSPQSYLYHTTSIKEVQIEDIIFINSFESGVNI